MPGDWRKRPWIWGLWWMVAGYMGSAVGQLGWQVRWEAINPLATLVSVVGAIIVPGLNLIMLAIVATSIVMLFKGRLKWSLALAFLGCAFVSRSMATFFFVPSRR